MQSVKLELQIELLEKKLKQTPEKLNGKYNGGYFALQNKIKSLKTKLVEIKNFEFLAQ